MVIRADGGESVSHGLKPGGPGDDPDVCGDVGPVDDAGQCLADRLADPRNRLWRVVESESRFEAIKKAGDRTMISYRRFWVRRTSQ